MLGRGRPAQAGSSGAFTHHFLGRAGGPSNDKARRKAGFATTRAGPRRGRTQRAETYIVISKPKRRSVAWGAVHSMAGLLEVGAAPGSGASGVSA